MPKVPPYPNSELAAPPYGQHRPMLPANFPAILKEYTREVLRSQPSDILKWSARYFKLLALQSDAPIRQQHLPRDNCLSESLAQAQDVLSKKLLSALLSLDEFHTGVVTIQQLRDVLRDELQLSPVQYLFLLTSPSTSSSQNAEKVDYELFLTQCACLFPLLEEVKQGFATINEDDAKPYGMGADEIEEKFRSVLYAFDEEGSGVLYWEDYCHAISNAQIPLTPWDLKIICIESERRQSVKGQEVPYEEELKGLFSRLVLSNYLFDFSRKRMEES